MSSRQARAASMSTCAVAAASFAPRTAPPRARQLLGRDAHAVGALATGWLVLDECDAQTALCEHACAVLARRAAADDTMTS
jgi:hypothetical protein